MSNILAKDRKPYGDDLVVLRHMQELTAETSAIVHNEKKIPKRKVDCIGKRLIDHCYAACEAVRGANTIFAESVKDQQRREHLAFKGECELNALIADIYLVPNIFKDVKDKQWYYGWRSRAVNVYKELVAWRISEEEKIEEFKLKERKEADERRIELELLKEQRRKEKEAKKKLEAENNVGIAVNANVMNGNIPSMSYPNPNIMYVPVPTPPPTRVIKRAFYFDTIPTSALTETSTNISSRCNSELLSKL